MFVIEWNERKRVSHLAKHGLDFRDATRVHDNPSKLTLESARKGETRKLDFDRVEGMLLAFAYVERGATVRAVSFRRASRIERRKYEKAVSQESH